MRTPKNRNGFTLIELLVVIFIIGALVALLFPAIQAAREAARKTQCKSHLKQLALAAITHEERFGHLPTGGWGTYWWVGDADRGFAEDQPGGWAFNILPFLEEAHLRDLAADGIPDLITEAQRVHAGEVARTPIPVMYCPSRRAAIAYARASFVEAKNAHLPELVAKLDYATNSGDTGVHPGFYARDFTEARTSRWCYDESGNVINLECFRVGNEIMGVAVSFLSKERGLNGVIFSRSEVGARHITDGGSNTFLMGEKAMDPLVYEGNYPDEIVAGWAGDRTPWSTGYNEAICRGGTWSMPRQDYPGSGDSGSFGSAHPAGCHMAYCDGSVRVVHYNVDWRVFAGGLNRKDGTVFGN
jgi:prepilin-type N-terminal cleavage/methylation domain-containing protein/prepilin-type processing-associated H-X9-DG protein